MFVERRANRGEDCRGNIIMEDGDFVIRQLGVDGAEAVSTILLDAIQGLDPASPEYLQGLSVATQLFTGKNKTLAEREKKAEQDRNRMARDVARAVEANQPRSVAS